MVQRKGHRTGGICSVAFKAKIHSLNDALSCPAGELVRSESPGSSRGGVWLRMRCLTVLYRELVSRVMNWKYKLPQDYEWNCGHSLADDVDFSDGNRGKLRLQLLKDGTIRVKEGYAWDGCSPKINIFDLFMIGTPDGIIDSGTGMPKTYHATLIHDALCQFIDHEKMPLKSGEIDRFFLELLRTTGFKPRYIYFIGVRLFGGVYRFLCRLFS